MNRRGLTFEKVCAALVVAAVTFLPATGEAPGKNGLADAPPNGTIGATGVALTPPHFPHQTDADIRQMFAMGKQVGTYAIFIYQWSQPDFKAVAQKVTEASQATNLIPVLALSPTQLGGARGELDLPAYLNAVRHHSFSEKPIYEGFLRDAVDLAKTKPPYLCLGTEINMLAFKDIHEYIYFAKIYKVAYALVKKESPNTKVFVSFQWDFFYQMYRKEPKKVDEQKKLIDIFRPELDVLAFTSYPADRFASPSEIPADYYSTLSRYTKPGDPVMFMEIGWPSSGKGSLASQQQFVSRLPELLGPVHPMLVAWSLLYDVGSGLPGGDLGSTGLLSSDGAAKPALAEFEKLGKF